MFSFHENTVGGRGIAEARAFDLRGRSGSGEVFIQRRVHFKL